MENLKFLTSINAVYNKTAESTEFNSILNLLIFINKDERILIKYNEFIYDDGILKNINKSEIILTNIGYMEYQYILNIFNEDENLFKNLIFNKFLDYRGDELNFDIIL